MGHNLACQQGLPSPGGVSANPPPQRQTARLVARREGAARTKKPRRSGAKFLARVCPSRVKANPPTPYHSRLHSVRPQKKPRQSEGAGLSWVMLVITGPASLSGGQAHRLNAAPQSRLHSTAPRAGIRRGACRTRRTNFAEGGWWWNEPTPRTWPGKHNLTASRAVGCCVGNPTRRARKSPAGAGLSQPCGPPKKEEETPAHTETAAALPDETLRIVMRGADKEDRAATA